MKKKIEAKIIADSIGPQGDRITSFILTYPRFIHAELMTHRMFSRNSASSRAIPFEKMLKSVQEDPFIPIAWQKEHTGMQGTEYIVDSIELEMCKEVWLDAKNDAVENAKTLHGDLAVFGNTEDPYKPLEMGVSKQLVNRLLEPFLWHTVLVTATEYQNFFDLRCPKYHTPVSGEGFTFKSKKECLANHSNPENLKKLQNFTLIDWLKINESQAEIHMQALAEAMYDAYNESTPKLLESGQWHIPFGDQFSTDDLHDYGIVELDNCYDIDELKLAISVARCARISYMTFENEIDYYKDMELYFRLLKSKHSSPFEHVARCMNKFEYYSFIKGIYPTIEDNYGILNYERMPFSSGNEPVVNFKGINQLNPDIYGWCYNFRGFIPYRYLIENVERTK